MIHVLAHLLSLSLYFTKTLLINTSKTELNPSFAHQFCNKAFLSVVNLSLMESRCKILFHKWRQHEQAAFAAAPLFLLMIHDGYLLEYFYCYNKDIYPGQANGAC